MVDKEIAEAADVLTQPVRMEIYKTLKEEGNPLYISEMAEKLEERGYDIERPTVSYHLTKMCSVGLLKDIPEVIEDERGFKAVKHYTLTDKAKKAAKYLKESL